MAVSIMGPFLSTSCRVIAVSISMQLVISPTELARPSSVFMQSGITLNSFQRDMSRCGPTLMYILMQVYSHVNRLHQTLHRAAATLHL